MDTRETKDIIVNGYIFTLVKGRNDPGKVFVRPNFMQNKNWALQSIIKMKKRERFPEKKSKKNEI